MRFSPASMILFAIKKLLCKIFEADFISFYALGVLLTTLFAVPSNYGKIKSLPCIFRVERD